MNKKTITGLIVGITVMFIGVCLIVSGCRDATRVVYQPAPAPIIVHEQSPVIVHHVTPVPVVVHHNTTVVKHYTKPVVVQKKSYYNSYSKPKKTTTYTKTTTTKTTVKTYRK